MYYDRAGMKLDVKEAIRETRPRPMWATLLYQAIATVSGLVILAATLTLMGGWAMLADFADLWVSYSWSGQLAEDAFAEALVRSGMLTPWAFLILMAGAMVSALWSALLGAGYQGYCLAMERRMQPGVEGLFGALSRFKTILLAQLLIGLRWCLAYGAMIIVMAVGLSFLVMGVELGMLVFLAAFGLWLAAVIWLTLRYAFVNYLILDNPDITARQALGESVAMLRGRKGELAVLYLSFIGWQLLAAALGYAVSGLGGGATAAQLVTGVMGGGLDMGGLIGSMLVSAVGSTLVSLAADMLLMPYIYGSEARFYDTLREPPAEDLPYIEEEPNVYSSGEESPAIPGYERPHDDGEGPGRDASREDPADPNAPDRPRYE